MKRSMRLPHGFLGGWLGGAVGPGRELVEGAAAFDACRGSERRGYFISRNTQPFTACFFA